MSTQTFAPGEIVDVVLRGATVADVDMDASDVLALKLAGAKPGELVLLPVPWAGVTVTRVAPAEWPPQLGDIWEDRDGSEWFAEVTDGETIIMRRVGAGGAADALDVLDMHGPMRLVRRRGWTPATDTTPAAALEPEQVDERAEQIAGLRALADLLESHPDVPAPEVVDSYHSVQPRRYGPNYEVVARLDEEARRAEVARIASSIGAVLSDEGWRAELAFGGAVKYTVLTSPDYRAPAAWLAELYPDHQILDPDGWSDGKPLDALITRGEFERRFAASTTTGPVVKPEPTDGLTPAPESLEFVEATAAGIVAAVVANDEARGVEVEHKQVAGWTGPDTCGVTCACGETYDGFDAIGEAVKLLKDHIADVGGAS